MEALKKNAFVAGMVVVGIVTVICFLAFVLGAWTEADSLRAQIRGNADAIDQKKDQFKKEAKHIREAKGITAAENEKDRIITEEWAQVFDDEKKHYSESIKSILKSYQAMDAAFEQWFPGVTVRDGKAEAGGFVARYADETPKVETMTKDAKIELGLSKKGDLFDRGGAEPDGYIWDMNLSTVKEEMLPDIQKRFWIRAKLGAALIAAKGVRLEKIEFTKVVDPGPGSPKQYDLPKMSADVPALGTGIPVVITAQLYYENIADFVRALLAAKLHAYNQIPREDFIPILMGVKEPPSGVPAVQFPVRIKKLLVAKTVTPPEKEKIAVREEELSGWKPPPPPKLPVRVTVECIVIDFNIPDTTVETVSKIE